jgi:hypothetical protein
MSESEIEEQIRHYLLFFIVEKLKIYFYKVSTKQKVK